MTLDEIKTAWLGKEFPVWWETWDNRPPGQHKARVLDVLEYTGKYNFIACIFVLAAPNLHKGQIEMSIEWTTLT